MNLYHVTTQSGHEFYVVANSATQAEGFVSSVLRTTEGLSERGRSAKAIKVIARGRTPENGEELLVPMVDNQPAQVAGLMASDGERVGRLADELDNIYHALQRPLDPTVHVEQLKAALPEKIKGLRQLVIDFTNSNPWEHHPKGPTMPA